jgi:excisionase family DNA binding protein
MELRNLPDVITVKELAEYLRIDTQTVSRALKAGKLKGVKVGNGWRIEKPSALAWLEKREKGVLATE